MLILTVLTIACCCGLPAYLAKPIWEQYPAKAVLPAEVADLSLLDEQASARTTERLKQNLGTAHWLADDRFAGVYADQNDKRVTVFGVTGFRLSPDSDVDAEIKRLTDEYQLTGVQSIETGTRGEYRSCGTGRAGGTAVVVCIWGDHGSLGTGLFTRRSVPDSANLLAQLRASIVIRDRAAA